MTDTEEFEELWKYAELEGTSVGKYCSYLCELRECFSESHGMSDEFSLALNKEISQHLKYFKENAEIKTSTETRIVEKTRLVWRLELDYFEEDNNE